MYISSRHQLSYTSCLRRSKASSIWRVFHDPPMTGGMVNGHVSLVHHLLQVAITQGVRHVPLNVRQYDILLELGSFEADHHLSPQLTMVDRGDHTRIGVRRKIRDRPPHAWALVRG